MITQQMWCIRHIPTGHYLIAGRGHNGRGSTNYEPHEIGCFTLPRFWHTQKAAKDSLIKWLQGIWHGDCDEYGSCVGHIQKVPTRKFEDMEIVPVTLEFP